MPGPIIPPAHSVARHCQRSHLVYGGPDGEPTGVNESAFRIKDGEEGLSVIWVDYFGNDPTTTIEHKLNCVRSVVSRDFKPSHRLAIVRVTIINAVLNGAGITPEVREDPCDDLPPTANAAHALIMPVGALSDKTIRDAIASSIRPSDLVSARLTFVALNSAY